MQRIQYYTSRLLIFAFVLLTTKNVQATDDPPIVKVHSGAAGEIVEDPSGLIASGKEVTDIIFYDPVLGSTIENPANDQITNVISLLVDESRLYMVANDFTAQVNIEVFYTLKNGSTGTASHILEVNYTKAAGFKYNPRQTIKFDNCRKVKVRVASINSIIPVEAMQLLTIENRMLIRRDYKFDGAEVLEQIIPSHTTPAAGADELEVNWSTDPGMANGKTHIDVEWTWVDEEAVPDYANNAERIFNNNSSRITVESKQFSSYKIPLIYDGAGKLYYRIRPVQYKESGQVVNGEWSAQGSANITVYTRTTGQGHQENLNWQTTTSFAEDGKRKTVVQYFDGTLRGRQTVTKDNVSNKTVMAETFYDYQGRPAINILPTPTMNSVIQFTADFNKFTGAFVTPKDAFDLMPPGDIVCNFSTPPLDKNNIAGGAAKYYSDNNPEKELGFNKFIPDANGYAYTETRYTPDATGRIEAQGGVGELHQLGKGNGANAHDTKYFYGKPDQKELDALFGNEAGEASHYFKNMVRDANGQYSVSYVDMHGRTVATALAGNVPANVKQLSSYANGRQRFVKDLINPANNKVEGRSVVASTTLIVTEAGEHNFHYELNPLSAEILACKPPDEPVCYDCYYDLEIRITRACTTDIVHTATNLSFINGVPQTDMSCSTTAAGFNFDFNAILEEGEYNIVKTLTVNKAAQDWYRENVFNSKNICRDLLSFYNENYTAMLATNSCEITCAECNTALGTYAQYRAAFLTQQGLNPANTVAYEAEIEKSYADAKKNCDDICAADKKNILGSIRQAMLEDMMPDQGQYGRMDEDLSLPDGLDNEYKPEFGRYEKYSNRPYNIFYPIPHLIFGTMFPSLVQPAPYKNPMHENGQPYYYDELGRIDMTVSPDLLANMIPETFTQKFKTSWANTLITKHPEYCKLIKAETFLKASYERDALIGETETWAAAVSAGFIDNDGTVIANIDPFFLGVGSSYQSTMNKYINTSYDRNAINISQGVNTLWKIAWLSVKCLNNATTGCASGAPVKPQGFGTIDPGCGDWDHIWRIFRTLYLSEKDRMVNQWLSSQCNGINYSTINQHKYERRFGLPEDFYNNTTYLSTMVSQASGNNQSGAQSTANTQLAAAYADNCESYKIVWINQLMTCDQIVSKPTATQDAIKLAITNGLKSICIAGSDDTHPMGSSTVPPGSGIVPASFQAVITNVFSTYGISVSALCHPDMIDYPQPYDKQIPIGDEVVNETRDECVCARLTELNNAKISQGLAGLPLSDYILSRHGISIRQTLIDTLMTGCSSSCNMYYPAIKIPAFLSCNTPIKNCISCHEFDSLRTVFRAKFPPLSNGVLYADPQNEDQLNANKAFALFMNNQTGFNKTWYEYYVFSDSCISGQTFAEGESGEAQALPFKLCNTGTMFPQIEVPEDCDSYVPTLAFNKAVEQYEAYVQQKKDEFDNTYLNKCLEARNHEVFTVSAPVAEYHYTLYYYDQAGNLVKTVPPAGVIVDFSSVFLNKVKAARADPQLTPERVQHNLQTQYRYNSLNQVIAQFSPDGGISHFWYDALGRLVVSQNEKQQAARKFSYTKYDALGRIIEVGEKNKQAGFTAMSQTLSQHNANLATWLTAGGAEPNKSITKTIYDLSYTPVCTNNYLCQQNLRNRVSYSYVQDTDDGSTPGDAPWNSASFYTYDTHGNVDVLLQDYKEGMGALPGGNRYKKIAYKYDLVSGKVNEVAYQPGFADAFYHRYAYDAENKLTEANTSKDYVYWEKDASYFYYRHGPLARTVIGQQQVQGIDYAYTLQGWLKGVNSTGIKSGIINGDGEDCGGTGGFDNLIVNARLSPYTIQYKAKTSIEFVPGFESNLPDNFETFIEPSMSTCGITGTTGESFNDLVNNGKFDMGQDGLTNGDGNAVNTANPALYGNNTRTTDAFGFSLNYFNGDYNRINTTAANPFATISMPLVTGDVNNAFTAQPLYNGNIGAMIVSIPQLSGTRVYGYNYDQLNRITNMHAFKGLNTTTNTFTPVAMDDYKESVSYDANGNILTYKRNGTSAPVAGGTGGLNMDDLGYDYITNTNKLKKVTDNTAYSSNYPNDIDNQADLVNYEYDAIGNLVRDKAEGLYDPANPAKEMIEWNVYGKISRISRIKDGVTHTIDYSYDVAGNRISKRVQKSSGSDVTTFYVRDASGNVMSVYEKGNSSLNSGQLTQTEIHLYGSSRLAVYNVKTNVQTESRQYITMSGVSGGTGEVFSFARGYKFFELSNHLGNVLVTVTDKKIAVSSLESVCEDHTGICYSPAAYYIADVATANDYYPGGMGMPGRSYNNGSSYRYGFNGKEKSSEIANDDYDFGARIYDGRIGRWLSIDPLAQKFPGESGYGFVSNSPLLFKDPDGEEKIVTITILNKDGSKSVFRVIDKTYLHYHTVKGTFKTAYQDRDHKESIAINITVDNTGNKSIVTRSIIAYDVDDNYTWAEQIQDFFKKKLESPRKYGWTMWGADEGVSPQAQMDWNSNLPTAEYSDHLGSITGLLDVAGNWREYAPLEEGVDAFKQELPDLMNELRERKLIGGYENEESALTLFDNLADALSAMKSALDMAPSVSSTLPNPNVTYCEACKGNYIKSPGGLTYDTTSVTAGDTTTSHGDKPRAQTKSDEKN